MTSYGYGFLSSVFFVLAGWLLLFYWPHSIQERKKRDKEAKAQADRDALLAEVKALRHQIAGEYAPEQRDLQPAAPAVFTPEPPSEISGASIFTILLVFGLVIVFISLSFSTMSDILCSVAKFLFLSSTSPSAAVFSLASTSTSSRLLTSF